VTRGDRAVVVKSRHSDIVPGIEGTIVRRRRRGYEIEITGIFSNALGTRAMETRVLFFSTKELERARPKLP